MTSSHATKGPRRYRYYRTRVATDAEPAWSTEVVPFFWTG
jgi:hypothetical protein